MTSPPSCFLNDDLIRGYTEGAGGGGGTAHFPSGYCKSRGGCERWEIVNSIYNTGSSSDLVLQIRGQKITPPVMHILCEICAQLNNTDCATYFMNYYQIS